MHRHTATQTGTIALIALAASGTAHAQTQVV